MNAAQQEIIDRYNEATKDCPESRMSVDKLLSLKPRIRRYRPDAAIVASMEDLMHSEDDSAPTEPVIKAGRKRTQLVNQVYEHFHNKQYMEERYRHYWLDDILTGVSRLDTGGNTRPLSAAVLFNVLASFETVDTAVIADFCNVGERQARNIMTAVSIAHRMILKELTRMLSL